MLLAVLPDDRLAVLVGLHHLVIGLFLGELRDLNEALADVTPRVVGIVAQHEHPLLERDVAELVLVEGATPAGLLDVDLPVDDGRSVELRRHEQVTARSGSRGSEARGST